jgi:hypothetical protein
MAHPDDDGFGDELDLDAVERQATKVQRRALDLDFDELGDRGGAPRGRVHGAGGLDADAFLSKKEKEAKARAAGGTPTLDRMGHRGYNPGLGGHDPVMDTELRLTRRGPPLWIWGAVAALVLVGAGGGTVAWMVHRQHVKEAAEAAAIQRATQRAHQAEEAREQGM